MAIKLELQTFQCYICEKTLVVSLAKIVSNFKYSLHLLKCLKYTSKETAGKPSANSISLSFSLFTVSVTKAQMKLMKYQLLQCNPTGVSSPSLSADCISSALSPKMLYWKLKRDDQP